MEALDARIGIREDGRSWLRARQENGAIGSACRHQQRGERQAFVARLCWRAGDVSSVGVEVCVGVRPRAALCNDESQREQHAGY